MKNLAKIRDEHEGAFTLVELLVVILIIGILAAIAIPAFLNQRKAAVDSSVESDVKNASTQIETWAVSNANANVPEFTVSATDAGVITNGAPAGTPMSDIEIGEGTTLTIISTGATGEYKIQGINADGNRANGTAVTIAAGANTDSTAFNTANGIKFDSTAGGLQG